MANGALTFPIASEYNPKGVQDAQRSFTQLSTDVKQTLGDASVAANSRLGDMDTALKKVSGSADQSKQVFGAFAGQATAQAAQLAGNLGPVGQVLGQIVNQASQAKLSFEGFVSIAAPIAAISVGFMAIKNAMAASAAQSKLNKELQDRYTKALIEGKTALEALQSAQDRFAPFQGVDVMSGKVKDIRPQLLDLGLNFNKTNALIAQGANAIKAWYEAQKQKIDTKQLLELETVYASLIIRANDLKNSTDLSSIAIRFGSEETAKAKFEAEGFANGLARVKDWSDAAAAAQKALVDAIDESQRALRAALEPTYANERAQLGLQRAQENYAKAKPKDQASALLDLKQAALDAAEAAAKLAESGPGGPNDKRAAGIKAITDQYQTLADVFKNNPALSRYFGNVPGAIGGATRQSMVGWNIAGPGGTYGNSMPATTVQNTTNNNTATANVVINVNGAYDPVMVAAQLRRLLLDDAIRRGLKGAVANSWILT